MVRIVRTPDAGIQIDETGKRSGRGAYLHRTQACWEAALSKDLLAHALKATLTPEERAALRTYAATLLTSTDVAAEVDTNL